MPFRDMEHSLVLIKPDALKLSLTGYLFSTLSEFHTGLKFAAIKVVHVTQMLAEEHYAEHKGKPFFDALLKYIRGKEHYQDAVERRRVIAVVYLGKNAVQKIREICGPTNPHEARETAPGTIRALGTLVPVKNSGGEIIDNRVDNLIHASANREEAEREIKLWFKPTDIMPYMRAYDTDSSRRHYYYKDGQLLTKETPGAIRFLAPDYLAWRTDLEALRLLARGKEASCNLNAVVAKYLVNRRKDE